MDFDAYTGRWYNVYYNYPTLAFSQPDCATAYYGKITSAEFPAISVNNSGLCSSPNAIGCTGNPSTIDGGTATYILGTASKDDASTDGDLNLQFTGVPRASVYSIIKLGPKTYGAGYYEYAVVGGELFLYVLARDVDAYFEKSGAVSKSQIQAPNAYPQVRRRGAGLFEGQRLQGLSPQAAQEQPGQLPGRHLRTERVRRFYAAARPRRRSRSHVVVVHARRLRQVRARRLRVLF